MSHPARDAPTTRTVVDGRTGTWPLGRRVLLIEQLDVPGLAHKRRWAVGIGRFRFSTRRAVVEQVRRGVDDCITIVTDAGTVRYSRGVGLVTLDTKAVRHG